MMNIFTLGAVNVFKDICNPPNYKAGYGPAVC